MMKKEKSLPLRHYVEVGKWRVQQTVKNHWYKVAMLIIVGYLLSQKDLSFHIDLNSSGTSKPTAVEPVSSNVPESETAQLITTKKESKPKTPKMSPAEQKRLKKQLDYVKRFEKVARAEMQKYGIPASITLAQGILESGSGESRLATQNNNHFGIKCFKKTCKKGHCTNFEDDHHKDFFVNYESAWFSYRAHSELLNNKRYRGLKQHGKNYREWALGLEELGYATSRQYAEKLIRIIENLELYRYDK
ncbi:MAG: glucosaminidase domain-containing protein [Bacteroidota bacterium]